MSIEIEDQQIDTAKRIALQLYPEAWFENSNIEGFRVDSNAGKRAVAETVAKHFLELREGCIHNQMLGLCDECASEVGKY